MNDVKERKFIHEDRDVGLNCQEEWKSNTMEVKSNSCNPDSTSLKKMEETLIGYASETISDSEETVHSEEISPTLQCSQVDEVDIDANEILDENLAPEYENEILDENLTPEYKNEILEENLPPTYEDSSFILEKETRIQNILDSDPVDIEQLRQLAIEDKGLINDELRRKAWPYLMQIDLKWIPKPHNEAIESHKDYNQVVLDVNRSLKRFPPGIEEQDRYILMDQLTSIIIRVLDKHTHLHYYQGYHDVAITFLLVMGEATGFQLVEKLSLTHLQDFMRPTMERTTYYLTYLYPILRNSNEHLYAYLVKSGVGTIFCLPWLITWYAHTLSDYRNVVRLYDFFLASPHLMPMYIAVSIILNREEEILSGDCDMASQHFILAQVPDSLPFESILKKAAELYSLHPPDELQEEVEELIKQKAIEEEEEKKRRTERRKHGKLVSSRKPIGDGFFNSILYKFSISPNQKRNYVSVAAFAVAATFATGVYVYYTGSPYLSYLKSFFPL